MNLISSFNQFIINFTRNLEIELTGFTALFLNICCLSVQIGWPNIIKGNLTDGFSFAFWNLVLNRLFIHETSAVSFSFVGVYSPNGFISAIGLFVKSGAQNTELSIFSGHNTIVACTLKLMIRNAMLWASNSSTTHVSKRELIEKISWLFF